ncbi:hypothetical protein JTB14_025495 [Gonioctena quinquepunctata]|nr:hypothetical protein JTB14_025495 [Gonioctena quinquepunctata]
MNSDIEDIPSIEDPHDTTDVTIVENLPVVVPANQISDIMEMVADIRSMCQITSNRVTSIVEHSVDRSRDIDTTDDVIKECLPLKTIDGLLNLEDLLSYNKIATFQFIKDEEELAQYCSWTGQKRKFKISDSKMMDILKQSVEGVFNATTDIEFELIVMDWMRFAKQRLKRKE